MPVQRQVPQRVQVDGQGSIAGDEHTVTLAEERHVPRCVTRYGNASPIRQAQRRLSRIERASDTGQAPLGDQRADRPSGQDAHQRNDEPPVKRVGVLRPVLTGNQRQLAGMHVDRHVPDARQLAGRAGVVGMNVGQQHRSRARPIAEQRLRSRPDQLAAAGPGRVDQRPGSTGPNKVDVRRSDAAANPETVDAVGDFRRRIVSRHPSLLSEKQTSSPSWTRRIRHAELDG